MRRRLPLNHLQLLPSNPSLLYRVFSVLVYPIPRTDWVEELGGTFRPRGGEDDVGEDVVCDYEGGGVVGGLGEGGGIGAEAEGCEEFAPGLR